MRESISNKTAQGQESLFAFFPILAITAVRNVRFELHIVLFFCCRGLEGPRTQPPKVCLALFGKPMQILLTSEKHFYRQQFSFVVSLIVRLTEQFEVACLFEIEKAELQDMIDHRS